MLAFIFIFFFSALFRLTNLNLIEFKADQAITIFQLKEFFLHPHLVQTGLISSINIYNFPLFNYLLIPFGLISLDAQFLTFVIGIINCLSFAGIYLILKRYFTYLPAFLVTVFIASSPWMILYSRSIWAQNLLFPFFLLWTYLILEILCNNNKKLIFWFGVVSNLIIQLHNSGFFLITATTLAFLISKIRIDWKKLFIGFVVGFIPAIPYLIFQLSNGCPSCKTFIDYQYIPRVFDPQNFLRPFQIIGGSFFHFEMGVDYLEFLKTFPAARYMEWMPIILLGMVMPFYLVIKKNKKIQLLILIFILLPYAYFVSRTTSYMHYYIVSLPLTMCIIAMIIHDFMSTRWRRTVVVTIFVVATIYNTYFNFMFYRFVAAKKNIRGDYGLVYSETKRFIDQETNTYVLRPDYDELRIYAAIFAQSNYFHVNVGDFFIRKNDKNSALHEWNKALEMNPENKEIRDRIHSVQSATE